MACNITLENISTTCGINNVGGIQRMYIANRERKDYFEAPNDWRRDSCVKLADKYANEEPHRTLDKLGFKKYDLVSEISNYTTTINKSVENNSVFYTTDVNLVFNTLGVSQYTALVNILKGEYVILLEGNDGTLVMVGNDQPVVVSGGNLASGTALEDGVQITLQLKCDSKEMPRILDKTGIADFESVAPATVNA